MRMFAFVFRVAPFRRSILVVRLLAYTACVGMVTTALDSYAGIDAVAMAKDALGL